MSRGDKSILGRWRIIKSEVWDTDALDLVGEAHITFGADNLGDMELIAIGARIDYRVEDAEGHHLVEFTFDGFDEMDPITGRGRGRIVGDEFVGKLFVHQGDESTFLAWRVLGQPKPNKRAALDRGQRAVRAKRRHRASGRGR